jgi:hypothetical protein
MPESNDSSEVLTDQFTRLNDELTVIRNVLDEIREQVTWGLHNGRVFLSLIDPDERDPHADAELEGHTVELAIRLQTSLTIFANDIAAAVLEQRTQQDVQTQVEVVSIEDAVDEHALSQLSQDDIKKITPQKKEESAESETQFSIKDLVQFELEGATDLGEIVSISGDLEAIVGVEENSDFVHISLDQLTKVSPSEFHDYDRWCSEVRDPANVASEGLRLISSKQGHARFEYEIAPLPDGNWAVSLQYGFYSGDYTGHGSPWKKFSSREECLEAVVFTTREFFTKQRNDASQTRARLEILDQLGSGLFEFKEPNPITNSEQQQKLTKTP